MGPRGCGPRGPARLEVVVQVGVPLALAVNHEVVVAVGVGEGALDANDIEHDSHSASGGIEHASELSLVFAHVFTLSLSLIWPEFGPNSARSTRHCY